MKTKLVYEYIKNLSDNKIIIYLDGFDSIINGSLNDAIRIFKEMKIKILFSKHNDYTFYGIEKAVYPFCKDNTILSAGVYGICKIFENFIKRNANKKCSDDQLVINKLLKIQFH